MKKKWFMVFTWIIIVSIFSLAIWSIYRELHAYKLTEIIYEIKQIPSMRIFLSLIAALLSYAALTGYDFLGVRYAGRKLPYSQVALTSFVSYIFSNNIGFSAFSGSAVRYRFYSAQGLSAVEIVKIIGFCLLTFWVGLIATASIFMVFTPQTIPVLVHLPFHSTLPLGLVFFSLFILYLGLVIFRKKPLVLKGNEFSLPSTGLVPLQLLFSLVDWIMAGLSLYILLPDSISIQFPSFLGLFILAQALAVISSVPGGVGIFESLILIFLSGQVDSNQLFSSLFLYRMVYYLIPLAIGIFLFLGHELMRARKKTSRILGSLGNWMSTFSPVVLSILTFIGGGILIFSGATPALPERLEWLKLIVPFPVMEASHFLGSLSGVLLMILSLGILNRTKASYYVTLVVFLAGSLFSLLKGFDYEEALILILFFLILLPSRKYFFRKARITPETLSFSWFLLVSLVLISSIWLGFFTHRHVEYAQDLWWKFELNSSASRFLRASLGVVIIFLSSSVLILIRAGSSHRTMATEEEMADVLDIMVSSGNSGAALALLPDKSFLFNTDAGRGGERDGFLMYGISGKTWIAMGDPVGEEESVRDLIWKFREETHHFGSRALFYEITPKYLPFYIELGFSLLKIGENAILDLDSFSMKGHDRSTLRNTINRLTRERYSFEVLERDQVRSSLPDLKTVSNEWLIEKKVREKGFSLGYFEEKYLSNFRTAIVRDPSGKILAFSNLWESQSWGQLSVDLMRYGNDAPGGLMDFLFIGIIEWAKENGYKTFDLGMAPFSGLPDKALAPVWNRLGATLFRNGENFYNFQGLRKYKDKFSPQWEPRYIALQGGITLPRTLMDLTSLINGGLLGVVSS